MLDPARAQILGSPGESAWGGAASTAFWVDFAEEMSVIFTHTIDAFIFLSDSARVAGVDLSGNR